MTTTAAPMLFEKKDGIGWMTFNNPERRNALSVEMRKAAIEILADFSADDSVRVVVMKGAGDKAFVSGADISQFESQRSTPEQIEAYSALSRRFEGAMNTLEKPLIAMIRGFCLGGGLAVALTADIRIAAEDAQFGIPAARLSLGYGYDGMRKLTDLVGPSCAKEILFTARRYSAAEALQMGLINRVLPVAELESHVRELATTIAGNAPLTIRAAKTIVGEIVKDPADRDMAACKRVAQACVASNDYVEGRRAFMEKRKPVFNGR
jgi:enoyl-CoA hydratase/carnithine racemase